MNIRFVSSVSVITTDPPASRRLFADALGLPLQADDGGEYWHSEAVDGVRHFDVEDASAVQPAADELRAQGFDVLHDAREEPWGQTVARLQSADGAIVGISYAPWMHS